MINGYGDRDRSRRSSFSRCAAQVVPRSVAGPFLIVAAAPFVFQVFVENDRPQPGGNTGERSAYVEVSPEALTLTSFGQSRDKAELDQAQQIARKATFEAIGVEGESNWSIAQIGELPPEVRDREMTLHKAGVRVWVVGDGASEVVGPR
jgi:hypothetical protein